MILKSRTESTELLTLRSLNTRMELTEKERYHYLNLEKGYEGELQFDQMTERLEEEIYIINDLLLEVNNSYFQIDTIIICPRIIHLFDVKNFYSECYYQSDYFYSVKTGRELKNPFDQLNRSTNLFRQLLQIHKLNFLVEANVVFINPEFTLYQAPMDQPFIFPNQINRFLNELNKTSSPLNDQHKKLAKTLLSLHQAKNPYTILPKYSYDQLRKGPFCRACYSLEIIMNKQYFVCKKCGNHEKISQAILRHINELKILFPDQMITTNRVFDWLQTELSKRTFCRILKKNFTSIGNTRDTFYE